MNERLNITQFEWLNLESSDGYGRWRHQRLNAAEAAQNLPPVQIRSLANPSGPEREEILRRCEITNFAHYAVVGGPDDLADPQQVRRDLRDFSAAFGLRIAEAHRSAGEAGIVALQLSDAPDKAGYIPYTSRGMNWHTDGYYNGPQERISAFVLHCVTQAENGGVNQILDPEILYIRLRDANPAYLKALLHPQAMTIPENVERSGQVRPASVGPVFYPDPETGRLQMRYTARTRSIAWRDDPLTREAEAFLRAHLASGDPLATSLRLQPGQGILNNNVLHDRTAFDSGSSTPTSRLIFRVRFLNRIGSKHT